MKTFYTLLFLTISAFAQAEGECEGTLNSMNGVGFINSNINGISSAAWLFHPFISTYQHPEDATLGPGSGGGECGYGILLNRNGLPLDTAYYTKTYDEPEDIGFRFILDTENLMQGIGIGEKIILTKFNYSIAGIEKTLLKIKLIKTYISQGALTFTWELKLQWFNPVASGTVTQSFFIEENDNFIDIEFFMRKLNSYSSSTVTFSKINAGVVLKSKLDGRPYYMLSPYAYENANASTDQNLIGTSYIGYINMNSNPPVSGSEIRIISPINYVQ
jgi:hypothetical protein